jgi:hypothetical protein
VLTVPAHSEQPDTSAILDKPRMLPRPCPCCGGRMMIIETFGRGRQPNYRPTPAPACSRPHPHPFFEAKRPGRPLRSNLPATHAAAKDPHSARLTAGPPPPRGPASACQTRDQAGSAWPANLATGQRRFAVTAVLGPLKL